MRLLVADALLRVDVQCAALEADYAHLLQVNPHLSRQLVSFQATKQQPVARWFKYREGFSGALVHALLDRFAQPGDRVLDPFAGAGTTLFAAAERGHNATGIELLPVGCTLMHVRQSLAGRQDALHEAVLRWRATRPWMRSQHRQPYPHLRFTQGAFPAETQDALERYLGALTTEPPPAADLLRLAALCVLEDISYTRKVGQYLRWDHRAGRRQGARPFHKGALPSFEDAITTQLDLMASDLAPQPMLDLFADGSSVGVIDVSCGSSLSLMPTRPAQSADLIITSPPYANRYDYTRTYALELAMLGYDEVAVRALRQDMLSCTVENRDKPALATWFPADAYRSAQQAFEQQDALQAILQHLHAMRVAKQLNNVGIPRMLRNYFWELTLLIGQAARVLSPGGRLIMVNDNVRYAGLAVPVDLILTRLAERLGFTPEVIWVLPGTKGNSSQQMGTHGRQALRKCVYVWKRTA